MTHSQHDYSHALGTWLDQHEWTHYATFTSRRIYSDGSAISVDGSLEPNPIRSGQNYILSTRAISPTRKMYRRRLTEFCKRSGPALMFWGTEAGPATGRIHAHALIQLPDNSPETTESLWRLGFRMFGRTHVEPFDPTLGAVGYCTKYVTKQLADFDLWTHGRYT